MYETDAPLYIRRAVGFHVNSIIEAITLIIGSGATIAKFVFINLVYFGHSFDCTANGTSHIEKKERSIRWVKLSEEREKSRVGRCENHGYPRIPVTTRGATVTRKLRGATKFESNSRLCIRRISRAILSYGPPKS